MLFSSVTRWLQQSRQSARARPSRPRRRVRPQLEALEDRKVPAVIKVTTTTDDNTPNDGSVSLREAIQAINNGTAGADTDIGNQNPGVFGVNDTINFNISAAGTVQTINVGGTGNGALPVLIKPMTINGYSEMGANMNTLANADNAKILIELNGANAGPNADGLLVGPTGAGSAIEGLAINRFSLNGIELQGGGATIAGNFVGTNPQGTAAEPNQNDGIHISNSSSSIIGGTTPGARNIVSGNQIDGIHVVGTTGSPATGNLIEGNFVGVNAAGTGSVGIKAIGAAAGTPGGNSVFGIEISGGNANTVGGATAAARNVVGLNAEGIEVDNGGQNNVIQGNYSGIGADGVTPVGNNLHGIALRSDDNLGPPLGPGQANEPAVSGNIIGLNPNTNFTGLGNLVEFNGTSGIAAFGNPLPNNATPIQNSGNSILGNSIFENGRGFASAASAPTPLLGIDLSNGFVFPRDDGFTANDSKGHGAANDPNNFQDFPILSSVVRVAGGVQITGTLTQSVSPNMMVRIEFFANNPDPLGLPAEGQTFLGATNVTTNGGGTASFAPTFNVNLTTSQSVTATATNLTADPSSQAGAVNTFNTSEFSAGLVFQASTTALTASPNPAGAAQSVTVTATVAPASGTGTPTGTVEFLDGSTPLATVALSGGSASFSTVLAVGTHTLTAVYSGGPNFAGSTSPAQSVQVTPRQSVGAFDATTGTWYLRNQNSAGPPDAGQFAYGGVGWIALVGDWLGTGQTTVAVVDPATETWYVRNSNTPGAPDVTPFRYGAPGWLPIVGDWAGTGHAGIGVVDPATNTFFLRNEVGPGAPDAGVFQYGAPSWTPVAGDWTGGSKAGIAVVDPTTATWYVRNAASPGGPDFTPFRYGGAGWTPVAGDWAGAGHAGIGVVDPTTNTFFLRSEVGPGAPDAGRFAYGAPGWTPLAGRWAPIPDQHLQAPGEGPGAAALADAALPDTVQAALTCLSDAGVDPSVVQRLAGAHFRVSALPPGTLGLAYVSSNQVLVSADGAGYGWFVDPTPLQDEEFAGGQALAGSTASGHEDLLTAVLHEMGHLAGLPDQPGTGLSDRLMTDVLAPGVRRTQALDQVFAGGILQPGRAVSG
jgi:CSLREA domain-containing protein